MNYNNITPEQFEEIMKTEEYELIDVRSPQELSEGSIPGHTMINFYEPDFMNKINELDRDKTYLLYCRSGNRSGQACGLMANLGFNKLFNLIGGIGAWNQMKSMEKVK